MSHRSLLCIRFAALLLIALLLAGFAGCQTPPGPMSSGTTTGSTSAERTTETPAPHVHDFTNITIIHSPCIVAGEQMAACACGATQTLLLPATGEHIYQNGACLGCGQNEIPLFAVSSAYDADGDGKKDVYYFSPQLSNRFANAVHVWAGNYDKALTASNINSTTAGGLRHWYVGEESQPLVYRVTVAETGLYEMVIHLRMKDAQERGSRYTVNPGTENEQVFEASHAFEGNQFETVRDADTLSSYMYGMTVNLMKGENVIEIRPSSASPVNQHYRDLYFVKVGELHFHQYGQAILNTSPSCSEEGIQTLTCTCGRVRTEAIPATGEHTFVNQICTECYRMEGTFGILYYDFFHEHPGYAGGSVEFCPETTDTYTFYWGNSKGTLSGYSRLYSGQFEAAVTAQVPIQSFTAIPVGATRLLAVDAKGTRIYSFDLPAHRRFEGEALYSFGAISDTHQGTRYGPESFAYNRMIDVLKQLADQGASLVGICGDIAYQNLESEYILHAEAIREFYQYNPNVPVYTVSGNHEAKYTGFSKLWYQTYAQHAVEYDTPLKPIFSDGNDLDFIIELPDGSVMVYLHQIYYDYGKKTSRLLDDSQLDWLGARLEQYKDRTVFLFFHTQMDDEVGDATSIGGSEGNLSLIAGTVDHTRLTEYFTKYTNVVYFSGHSHFPFDVQFVTPKKGKTNFDKNIDNKNGSFATMVHLPSVAAVSELTDASTSAKANNQRSEGYIVYVYEDRVVFQGYDFIERQAVSYATYVIAK